MTDKLNLKAHAESYEWQGVIFWLLPFRGLQTDLTLRGLEAVHPQWKYVNKSTGKETTDEPDEYQRARVAATESDAPIRSAWERQRLWGGVEDVFCLAESITVGVDFPKDLRSAVLRAFSAYWKARPSAIAERWAVFQQFVGVDVAQAWWDAYEATRDKSMDAPEALQNAPGRDADPNAVARTSAPSASS